MLQVMSWKNTSKQTKRGYSEASSREKNTMMQMCVAQQDTNHIEKQSTSRNTDGTSLKELISGS